MGRGRRDTPLIAGRIHGIRVWELDWVEGDAHLQGFNGRRWEPRGAPTVAECAGWRRARTPHRAPHSDCSCGLYATHPHSAEIALGLIDDQPTSPLAAIAGIVEAWGRVELHEDGFRAEYARPVALALVEGPADSDLGLAVGSLADRYAAAMLELDDHEELVAYCRARDLGLSPVVVRSLVAEEREDAGPEAEEPEDEEPEDEEGDEEGEGEQEEGVDEPDPEQTSRRAALRTALRCAVRDLRRTSVGDRLWMVVIAVVGIAWYGFLGWVGISLVLAVIGGITDDPRPEFTARQLEITEQALVRRGGEVRYVALVRNTSARQVAVAAFPRGRVLDGEGETAARLGPRGRVEHRPTLLPGETGVVIDEVPRRRFDGVPATPRFATRVVARHRAAGGAEPPFVIRSTDLDRETCRLSASLEARAGVRAASVALVARDGRGAISAAGVVTVGRLAPGDSRRELSPELDRGCPRWWRETDALPNLSPEQAIAG